MELALNVYMSTIEGNCMYMYNEILIIIHNKPCYDNLPSSAFFKFAKFVAYFFRGIDLSRSITKPIWFSD